MEYMNKKAVREQLRSSGTHMKYSLGQNYLIDSQAIWAFRKYFLPDISIIEIGPGIGNITITYFKNYSKVILIEIDKEKIPLLKKNLTEANDGVYPHWVTIMQGNFFDIDLTTLQRTTGSIQIIGALPYNLSKKIILECLQLLPRPLQCTFIIQREVADIYVPSREDERSFLSISSHMYATIKKKEIIKNTSFYPVPKVKSRIIIITDFKGKSPQEIETMNKEANFIKQCFANPMKKLSNVIDKSYHYRINPHFLSLRAHQLTHQNWMELMASVQ